MVHCNVAVTGLNAMEDSLPGIPVIRSLRAAGEELTGKIIGLTYDTFDTGIYNSELLDEVYLMPYPSEGETAILQRLKEIVKKTPIQVLIPTVDAELVSYSRLEPELNELGIKVLLPPEDRIRLHQKQQLGAFCYYNGIKAPRTITITDPAELSAAAKQVGFPFVLKGTFHDAYMVSSLPEALVFYHKIKEAWGLPMVVQEYIKGEEYTVVALADGSERLVGAVAIKKLRVTGTGKCWAGGTVHNEELLALARGIIEKLRWVGPLELEFIKRPDSPGYYLFEFNPRFPVTVYLVTRSGHNFPLALVRLLMGEKVEKLNGYQAGVVSTRHTVDVIAPMEYIESLATKGELIFDWKRKKEFKKELISYE
ncbi:MAG: ATP-grasp domain-containing protein [Dehalococcoidia bacterium]